MLGNGWGSGGSGFIAIGSTRNGRFGSRLGSGQPFWQARNLGCLLQCCLGRSAINFLECPREIIEKIELVARIDLSNYLLSLKEHDNLDSRL